jgi:hypothetical protein
MAPDMPGLAQKASKLSQANQSERIPNAEMIATKPDYVTAIHRDLARSKGTKDCVKQALEAGLDVFLFDSEHGEPKRIKAADERQK